MEWESREESDQVEDRRRLGPKTLAIGGGVGGILIVILALVFGIDQARLAENSVSQMSKPNNLLRLDRAHNSILHGQAAAILTCTPPAAHVRYRVTARWQPIWLNDNSKASRMTN